MATFVVTNPTDSLTNGVPTPNTLRWAVNQADLATQSDDPSVIDFSLGGGPTTITLTQGPLVLNNTAVPISIVGPGSGSLAVSGGDLGRMFDVEPSVQATISGLELENGRSSFGGAIKNQGNLTVLGCEFVGNTAPPFSYYYPQTHTGVSGPGEGGAIYNTGTLSLADCTLTGNSATFGGAIDEAVFYGAISLSLKDCTLSGNSSVPIPAFFGAEGSGGAINSENVGGQSTISLTNCTLSNNFGAPDGGAIGAGTYDYGATTLSLLNCTLSGNSSTGNGGAVASYSNTLTLTGCTLAGNTAGGSGGGAYITGSGILTGCTLTGNTAAGSGGGAYITGTGTLTGCTLTGNKAGGAGGGGIHAQGSLELTGCTVSDNSAGSAAGGGISHSTGTLAMTDCTVSGNIGGGGGGIFSYGYLIVHRGFGYYGQYNLPVTEPGTASATLSGCTISGNSASQSGGAILNITGAIVMTDCTVSGNTATSGGGIVNRAYYDNDQVRYLPYGVAYGVTVTEPGAASLALSACTIDGNSASQGGGGIENVLLQPGSGSAQAKLTDTIVAGNVGADGKADDIGGNDSADVTGSYNLVGTGGSGGLTAAGHNLLNIANPGLAPLGDYGGPTETMALQPGSPARHAGTRRRRGEHRPARLLARQPARHRRLPVAARLPRRRHRDRRAGLAARRAQPPPGRQPCRRSARRRHDHLRQVGLLRAHGDQVDRRRARTEQRYRPDQHPRPGSRQTGDQGRRVQPCLPGRQGHLGVPLRPDDRRGRHLRRRRRAAQPRLGDSVCRRRRRQLGGERRWDRQLRDRDDPRLDDRQQRRLGRRRRDLQYRRADLGPQRPLGQLRGDRRRRAVQ